jgi:acetyl esterase/lipase
VARHADQIDGDGGRIAVGGDSAFGNLAAVVTHVLRDDNSPRLAFQLLVYPVTEYLADTPSAQACTTLFSSRANATPRSWRPPVCRSSSAATTGMVDGFFAMTRELARARDAHAEAAAALRAALAG